MDIIPIPPEYEDSFEKEIVIRWDFMKQMEASLKNLKNDTGD